MNGEINNYISGNFYQANGVILNSNTGDLIGTVSGNIAVTSSLVLSSYPNITITDNLEIQSMYK